MSFQSLSLGALLLPNVHLEASQISRQLFFPWTRDVVSLMCHSLLISVWAHTFVKTFSDPWDVQKEMYITGGRDDSLPLADICQGFLFVTDATKSRNQGACASGLAPCQGWPTTTLCDHQSYIKYRR
jgi:hypothetical protein